MTAAPTSAPKVVAMVPTWNGARYVTDTLASLAAQDYENLEVLVLDDVSDDGTAAICRQFAQDDPRFHFECQERHVGWIDNANALLALADGDFAFFAPHDDLFAPSYVRRMVEALEARPDATLAYSHTIEFDDDGHRELRTAEYPARSGSRVRRGLRYLFMEHRHGRALPFRGVVRIEALRRAGRFRRTPTVAFGVDVRWLLRLNLLGPFVLVPEALCEKRVYPAGTVHGSVVRRLSNPDVDGVSRVERVRVRGENARTRLAETAAYGAEIRAASLPVVDAFLLHGGVAVKGIVGLLPWAIRAPARRFLASIFVERG